MIPLKGLKLCKTCSRYSINTCDNRYQHLNCFANAQIFNFINK